MGRVRVTSSHTRTRSGTGRAPPVCSRDNVGKTQTGNADSQGLSHSCTHTHACTVVWNRDTNNSV